MEAINRTVNKNCVFVRANRRCERIDLSELVYVESFRGYVKLFTLTRSWMVQSTMLQLEKQLPADKFVRIHRSYIVSIERVLSFDKTTVIIKDEKGNKKELEIGTNQYKTALMERVTVLGDVVEKGSIASMVVVG